MRALRSVWHGVRSTLDLGQYCQTLVLFWCYKAEVDDQTFATRVRYDRWSSQSEHTDTNLIGVVPSQRKKSQDVPSQQQNAVKASPHQPPHLGSDRDVTARTPEDTLAPIDLPDIDSDDDEALRQPEHSPDSPARERTPSVFSSESDDDEEMITIVATKRATKPVPGLWKPNSADAANIEALWTETLTGKEKGSMYLIPEQLDSHLGWADRKTRRTDSEAKYIERLWTETLTNKSDAPMYLIEEQLDTRLGWTPAPQVDSPPSDSGSSEGETFEECSPSSGTSHAVSDQTSSSTSRPNDGQKCYSLDDMLWNNHNPYCT